MIGVSDDVRRGARTRAVSSRERVRPRAAVADVLDGARRDRAEVKYDASLESQLPARALAESAKRVVDLQDSDGETLSDPRIDAPAESKTEGAASAALSNAAKDPAGSILDEAGRIRAAACPTGNVNVVITERAVLSLEQHVPEHADTRPPLHEPRAERIVVERNLFAVRDELAKLSWIDRPEMGVEVSPNAETTTKVQINGESKAVRPAPDPPSHSIQLWKV